MLEADVEIDTSGLTCPLPILRMKKALNQLESGQVVKVFTTDPHAEGDFQDFCRQTQNILLSQEQTPTGMFHYIKRR
ncbi:sulfurtransferase TusA family protein [Basilea psittacipulmonis]|uniref:UPF0033 domain-containing protein n=1 Tax=Basilea psittacipulmonis DSM 24701 TaxID=1072685 RepID=A0A077DD57_9BURK|nr:sulfurtransferase TusA family protein [Basilea psittacipulmonis]AIL32765.1 hypothetical protein IX83_05080 [Basilea psittacipulmonis DSM 24701]